jgi:hypothetical protein
MLRYGCASTEHPSCRPPIRPGCESPLAPGPVGRRVWVLTGGWTIDRIDPPWSAVNGSVQLPTPPNGPTANLGREIIAGPGGTLWVGGQALYQVSEATMRVRTISRFGAVNDVTAFGQALWVQASDGSVYQVALHRPST